MTYVVTNFRHLEIGKKYLFIDSEGTELEYIFQGFISDPEEYGDIFLVLQRTDVDYYFTDQWHEHEFTGAKEL